MADNMEDITKQLQEILWQAGSGQEVQKKKKGASKEKVTVLQRKPDENKPAPRAIRKATAGGESSEKSQTQNTNNSAGNRQSNRSANKKTDRAPAGQQTMIRDPDLTPEMQIILEAECLFLLKKKSPRFPEAKYYCRLCDYHCDNILVCQKHIKDNRHKRLSTVRATDIMLKSLPGPTQEHSSVITSLVTDVCGKVGLSDEDKESRQKVVPLLSEVMASKFPDDSLTLYGSTAMGFGLKDSDLNIDLNSSAPAVHLAEIYLLLKQDQSGNFKDVKSDFSSKVPSVLFRNPSLGNTLVKLSIGSSHAQKTTKLLKLYGQIDSRVPILATVFRHWAKMVKIDEQESGTLPSYVFYLMTVYYLQQCKPPVLPVLHELKDPSAEESGKAKNDGYFDNLDQLSKVWKCKNDKSVGELWIDLLKFYAVDFDEAKHIISIRQSRPMSRQEKKWTSKRIGIEDPFESRKRNVAKTVSHSHIYEYIDERTRAAYLYFGNPQTKNGPVFTPGDFSKLQQKLRENLKHKHEVSQRSSPQTTGAESPETETATKDKTAGLKLSKFPAGAVSVSDIESGATAAKNSATPVSSSNVEQDVEFGAQSEIFQQLTSLTEDEPPGGAQAAEEKSEADESIDVVVEEESMQENKDSDSEEFEDAQSDTERAEESVNNSRQQEADTSRDQDTSELCSPTHSKCTDSISGLFDESLLHGLRAEDFVYSFTEASLCDGKGPAVMCQICQKEGHLKMACPEENLPDIEPLPPLTEAHKHLLDHVMWRVPEDFKPSDRELRGRREVLAELEDYIQEFYPDAKLEAFGSSCNGFGFKESDLDICLTFTESDPKVMDFVEIIEDLAVKLKKHRSFYQVFAITSAKVPIVKFRHRATQVEGDVSLYNTLGSHNTRLLHAYCKIDPRVQPLGYIMKVFAKLCDIGDASRGSLSSYAYIIMVIYYLQQCNPPVLPVLQELYDDEKPTVMVDGWNTWYFDDFKNLVRKWPGLNCNKESLAELWVGMLKFFSVDFNSKDYVVCIRQLKPLTRFEKLWNGMGWCIEDPFDLSHNLGGGVSRKMSIFIRKTLRNGYVHHGTPLDVIPPQYPTPLDYLFDRQILTDSEPPNDRGCKICGKIGHFARECPVVLHRKERQAREREERDMVRRIQHQRDNHARQQQQQIASMMDALVVNDLDYRIQREMASQRNTSGMIPVPGGGRGQQQQQYQRSYSQGTPPSTSSLVSNGSPRVSPLLQTNVLPFANQHQPFPAFGYVNSPSVSGGPLTWQQEQLLQSQQPQQQQLYHHGYHHQHHHPHQNQHQRGGATGHQYHSNMQQQQMRGGPHSPSSPSTYYQQPYQPSSSPQQQHPAWWYAGSPGSMGSQQGRSFPPQR